MKYLFVSVLLFIISNSFFTAQAQTWQKLSDSTNTQYAQGQIEIAIENAQKAIAQAEKEFGKNSVQFVSSQNFLALLYHQMEQYSKAEPLYIESSNSFKKLFGEDHPNYGQSLLNLGILYYNIEKYEEAVKNLELARTIFQKNYGNDSKKYTSAIYNLARIYYTLKNYNASEELFIEALENYKDLFTVNNQNYIIPLNELITLYLESGNYEKAEKLLYELLNIEKRIFGINHPEYLNSLEVLSQLYETIGDYEKARKLLIEIKDVLLESHGEYHPDYINTLESVAKYWLRKGNYQIAEKLFLETLQRKKQQLGGNHIEYAETLINLSELHEASKRYTEALEYHKKATKIFFSIIRDNSIKKQKSKRESIKSIPDDIKDGNDYALMFAIDTYQHTVDLQNPVFDARTIGKELRENYSFSVDLVENSTHKEILSKLRKYAMVDYNEDDQLFIFFAGHGHFDEVFKEGFVVTKDSYINDQTNVTLISYNRLRSIINNIPCKHIFLVMDVCFGGTFDPEVAQQKRGVEKTTSIKDYIIRKMKFTTRKYLTSGGNVTVYDGTPGSHSPFTRRFLEALRSYGGNDRILTLSELTSYIEILNPQPIFSEFGDNEPGSDFIFIAK